MGTVAQVLPNGLKVQDYSFPTYFFVKNWPNKNAADGNLVSGYFIKRAEPTKVGAETLMTYDFGIPYTPTNQPPAKPKTP